MPLGKTQVQQVIARVRVVRVPAAQSGAKISVRLKIGCRQFSLDPSRCIPSPTTQHHHLTAIAMPADHKRKMPKAPAGHAKRRKTQTASNPKRAVAVDALSWKTVDVPEMFDDAEGFYGLEVVEGVDIVKDGGTVKFVSSDSVTSHISHTHVNFRSQLLLRPRQRQRMTATSLGALMMSQNPRQHLMKNPKLCPNLQSCPLCR